MSKSSRSIRLTEKPEHLKASVRAKVEHLFYVTLLAFADLVLAGRRFTFTEARSPS